MIILSQHIPIEEQFCTKNCVENNFFFQFVFVSEFHCLCRFNSNQVIHLHAYRSQIKNNVFRELFISVTATYFRISIRYYGEKVF